MDLEWVKGAAQLSMVTFRKGQPGAVAGQKEYRTGARTIRNLAGEEYVMGGTEGLNAQSFKTNIGGEWAYPGRGGTHAQPSIDLGMDTTFITARRPSSLGGFPDPEDAPGVLTEAEFFEVWDAVIASVRPRPIVLAQPRSNVDETSSFVPVN